MYYYDWPQENYCYHKRGTWVFGVPLTHVNELSLTTPRYLFTVVDPFTFLPSRRLGFRHVHKDPFWKQPGNPSIERLRRPRSSDPTVSITRTTLESWYTLSALSLYRFQGARRSAHYADRTWLNHTLASEAVQAERSMILIGETIRRNPAPCRLLQEVRAGLTKFFTSRY